MANLLSSIDTTVSAKNLASSLIKTDENGEYKTYFLNGEWGSGKTQFLKQVESQIEHPKFLKYHFRYIKLWETTDDKPVTEQIFRSLHPLLYWIVILSILISAISAVVYPFVEKVNSLAFLHNSTIYQSITKAFIPLTLIALTWKFVNYKSDYLYIKLLKCHNYLEKAKFPKNILIIDDFDRVDKEVQSQAYKAAYILQHKMPIIFVGNILNIVGATDNSIQKIIDVRIGLPFNLQPQNIWEEYLNNLSKYLGQNFDSSIYYIPVVENRNLRDRERLDYYLQKEFISRRKSEYTNIDQQFVIIYFYVFYPSMYDELARAPRFHHFFRTKKITKLSLTTKPYKIYWKKYFLIEKNSHIQSHFQKILVPILLMSLLLTYLYLTQRIF
ncbi:P-loop NTPase fold protein [uncultured Weissella sp.]|uniref:P-loop NTPase fold protein n=1 Tax=uncultured Weissella sp. TaxID=253243 RepID=UPI00338F5BDD